MSIATGDDPVGNPLPLFLCQLVLIIALCKAISRAFQKIKQPSVVAEVVTGIILGPSVFGYIPHYLDRMFPESSMTVLEVISKVGLILFMFLVGLEVDLKTLRENYKASIAISLSSIALPFGLGCASSTLVYHTMVDTSKVGFGSFLLFIGVALSITAFPVLARILSEYEMLQSKVGATCLNAAAAGDVLAWVILAAAIATAKASTPLDALYTFLMLVGFVIFMFFVGRKGMQLMVRKLCKQDFVSPEAIVCLLLLIFISAWFTEVIGVHAIFGGFIVGVITPRQGNLAVTLTERFEDIVVVLFLPLYFAFSGLRTSLGSMNSKVAWGCLVLVTASTCIGKIAGSVISAKLLKHTWRESFAIGVLMNTKGLVELIVLNIGLDVGVLNEAVFTLFVIMALITTFMTTPLLHFVWLRHQKKDKNKSDGDFRLNFYVSDPASGASLATVAHRLTAGAPSYKITAGYLNEVSERPSSYFFRDNLSVPHQLLLAQERAHSLGMKMNAKMLNTSDAGNTIVEDAENTKSNIVLLKWDLELSHSAPNHVIQYVSSNCYSFTVGILADNGFSKNYFVKRLDVILTGQQHEEPLVQLLKQLINSATELEIHIYAVPKAIPVFPATRTIELEQCENPFETFSKSENETDLLLVGVPVAWYEDEDLMHFVKNCPVSVLLIQGPISPTSHDTEEVELPAVSGEIIHAFDTSAAACAKYQLKAGQTVFWKGICSLGTGMVHKFTVIGVCRRKLWFNVAGTNLAVAYDGSKNAFHSRKLIILYIKGNYDKILHIGVDNKKYDLSDETCRKFGAFHGDELYIEPWGHLTVVGVRKNKIWAQSKDGFLRGFTDLSDPSYFKPSHHRVRLGIITRTWCLSLWEENLPPFETGFATDQNMMYYITDNGIVASNRSVSRRLNRRTQKEKFSGNGYKFTHLVVQGNTLVAINSGYSIHVFNLRTNAVQILDSQLGQACGSPKAVALHPNEKFLYVTTKNKILQRKLDARKIDVYAGQNSGYVDGPTSDARFSSISAITVASDGTIFVCDAGNIRQIKNNHVTTIMACHCSSMAVSMGNLFVITDHCLRRIDLKNKTDVTLRTDKYSTLEVDCITTDVNGRLLAKKRSSNKIIALCNPWEIERTLWIGWMKEKAWYCPIARLAKDVLKLILRDIKLQHETALECKTVSFQL